MGSHITGWGYRPVSAVIFALFMLISISWRSVLAGPSYFNRHVSDECDWSGSGLDYENEGNIGVQPVYLRCKEGKIEWHYPRGAMRIVLRLGHSNKDFYGCIKVAHNSSGAIIYLEGYQKLQILYPRSDVQEDNHLCFKSSGGQVALFLEAQVSADSLKKDIVQFLYDLQPIDSRSYSECRPCSGRELLYLFCTSDFVARGIVTSIYQNQLAQQTEITIKANSILRDSSEHPVFHHAINKSNHIVHYGIVHRPLHCGTQVGSGEFLFLGRWKLGKPELSCAPRWSEWKKVRRRAFESESLDCLL